MADTTGSDVDVFWGEIAPCEHIVQIYTDTGAFLDRLHSFVREGLASGDGVIVIATATHRHALETRLREQGVDIEAARASDQYIILEAAETLSQFMVAGWPDEDLFIETVKGLIARARGNGRSVRAFGEMVAVLWGRGEQAATVRLEHLWHGLCNSECFSLFCAYPRVGFTQDTESSIAEICAAHSKVVTDGR